MGFYSTLVLVYLVMHGLTYFLACRALHLAGPARLGLASLLIVLAASPFVLGMLGERTGIWSFVTFFWMGMVFYLFLGGVLLLAAFPLLGDAARRAAFLCLVAGSLGVCLYGVMNARDIRVVPLTVQVTNLPPGMDRVRLAVISDLHLYSVEEGRRLDRVLPVLETLDYDALVSLGDLVESGAHQGDWQVSAARLATLHPRLGKFAVDGNHERYAARLAGEDFSAKFLQAAGFRRLRNETVDVGGLFRLVGLDYSGQTNATKATTEGEAPLLAAVPRDLPVVVLKHLPTVAPDSVGHFDLQLSGHSHAGQLWPFTYLVKRHYPYIQGLYDLGRGSRLYVNVGTAGWGPPMRVGSHPEITLVTLERAPAETR
ncbi:hypothetical protein JCM15519_08900 [Fundidesulfovibrio butyratiphilus]